MKYRNTGIYERVAEQTRLVPFNSSYALSEFDCGIDDYNTFLTNDAQSYVNCHISSVHLLIDRESHDIIAYIAYLADAFLLDTAEKARLQLDIPFHSVPALKIGKLAVSRKWNSKHHGYGSFLLELSLGVVQSLIDDGVACRFLTVDADVEFDARTPEFYLANGFVYNEHSQYARRQNNRSMRYDFLEN